MTDKDQLDDELENFFVVARNTPPKPSSALSVRMLEDAEIVRTARVHPSALRRPERRNVLSKNFMADRRATCGFGIERRSLGRDLDRYQPSELYGRSGSKLRSGKRI